MSVSLLEQQSYANKVTADCVNNHTQAVKQNFRLIVLTSATEEKSRKAISSTIIETMRQWKQIMQERAADHPTSNDQDIAESYPYFTAKIKENAKKFKDNIPSDCTMIVLTDCDQQIQAVATMRDTVSSLYIEILLSAPWNIPLSQPNKKEHQLIAVKGAGTTLVRQVYELARLKNKSKVKLTSIPTADSFYLKNLKMRAKAASDTLYFNVDPHNIPDSLKVPSGNLVNANFG